MTYPSLPPSFGRIIDDPLRVYTWPEDDSKQSSGPVYKGLTRATAELHGSSIAAASAFSRVDRAAEAEVFLAPLTWSAYVRAGRCGRVREYAAVASGNGKRLAVWLGTGDLDAIVPVPDAILVNEGFELARPLGRTLSIPSIFGDKVPRYIGDWEPMPWSPRPLVGFCGQAAIALGKSARMRATNAWRVVRRHVPKEPRYLPPTVFDPVGLRARVLCALEADGRIDTRFMVRDVYRAGLDGASREEKQTHRSTQEFHENVASTAYTVCVRGGGNFSVRLYETLCHGRIPILIDTGSPLPMPDLIDWDDFMVRVPHDELDRLPDALMRFNARFEDRSFRLLQRRCRDVWLEYLSESVVYPRFAQQLRLSLR